MQSTKRSTRVRWIVGIIVILLVTAFGSQNIYPQSIERKYPLGDIPLDPATYQQYLKVQPDRAPLEALDSSYDARDERIVTPAKDQGNCGSCWAFASVGAMESHILKKFGLEPDDLDLSEQQQVSCNTEMLGCSGGSSDAMQYWEDKGPLYESCFPYTAIDSTTCIEDQCEQLDYHVVGWHTVPTSPADFKNSLYTYGPSYWRYDVYSDFYTYWDNAVEGEVYVQKRGGLLGGHAVLLIGWDDAKGAYLLKNSWGATGGPNGDGTFWVAYSGHRRDLGFGMANFSLGCSSDAECDDGLFCTGTEYCNEGTGSCESTGDPCDEGTVCDEGLGSCLPLSCNGDDVCDPDENCDNCPSDCRRQGGGTCEACFKGVCDGSCHPVKEDLDCADCSPSYYYCCGDGVCEGEENTTNCAVDCP